MPKSADCPDSHCQEAPARYGSATHPWASLADIHANMAQLEQQHPEWFHAMDCLDPCADPAHALLAAMARAPDPFLGGMVYGFLVLRTRLDGLGLPL